MPKSFPKFYLVVTPSGDCERLEFDRRQTAWSEGKTSLYRDSGSWRLESQGESIECKDMGSQIVCGEYVVHSPTVEPSRKPASKTRLVRSRVGDHLKSVIKNETGATPKLPGKGSSCSCSDLAKKMNQWGISGCESRRDEIISQLVATSKNLDGFDNVKIIYKIGSALPVPVSLIEKIASRWLDKAIELTKADLVAEQTKRKFEGTPESALEELKKPLKPNPFTGDPKATLLFHCYPINDWEKHAELMDRHARGYSRKIMSIAVDENTPNINEIKGVFGDSWEYITVPNDPALREVLSYRKLFKMAHAEDPNSVVVCAHGKGAQSHTVGNKAIEWWTRVMYESVVGNLPEIYDSFEKGYRIAGSFRRVGRQFGCRYRYHYSGTFYALRSNGFFLPHGNVPRIKDRWWGTESLPGDVIPFYQSKCIVGDLVGDMYKEKNHPVADYEKWKEARDARD